MPSFIGHNPDQPGEALNKVFFPMWFKSEDGMDIPGPQEPEECREINGSPAYWKVIVTNTTIVMHMDLFQKTSQRLNPFGQRCSGKAVLVANIQAEAEIAGIQPGKEFTMKVRPVFPDILQEQRDPWPLGPHGERLPYAEAPLQKAVTVAAVVFRIVPCVADDLDRLNELHQVKELLEPKPRHLAYQDVGAAGAKAPERTVKSDSASSLMQLFHNRAKLAPRNVVELFGLKTHFDIDPVFEDHL